LSIGLNIVLQCCSVEVLPFFNFKVVTRLINGGTAEGQHSNTGY
jgi:hypothetical protein